MQRISSNLGSPKRPKTKDQNIFTCAKNIIEFGFAQETKDLCLSLVSENIIGNKRSELERDSKVQFDYYQISNMVYNGHAYWCFHGWEDIPKLESFITCTGNYSLQEVIEFKLKHFYMHYNIYLHLCLVLLLYCQSGSHAMKNALKEMMKHLTIG